MFIRWCHREVLSSPCFSPLPKCPAQPWVGAVRLDVAQDDALSVKENTVSPTNELED